MKIERLNELMKLPLKDRVVNFELNHYEGDEYIPNTKDYVWNEIIDRIERTKNKFDYFRYINRQGKSEFYNGHYIDSEGIVSEYENCKGNLLVYNGSIYVVPLWYLLIWKIDDIPNYRQLNDISWIMSDNFDIHIFNKELYEYKYDLELNFTDSELADYEDMDDIKFMEDKISRIQKLKRENCRTYDDYNRICGG